MTPYEEYEAKSIDEYRAFRQEQKKIAKEQKEKARERKKKANYHLTEIYRWKDPKANKNAMRISNDIYCTQQRIKQEKKKNFENVSIIDLLIKPK